MQKYWCDVSFSDMKVETGNEHHVFTIQVYFDDLDPEAVQVELYAQGTLGGMPARQKMIRMHQLVAACNGYSYEAAVPAARPASDYTVRLIPNHEDVMVTLEADTSLCQRG